MHKRLTIHDTIILYLLCPTGLGNNPCSHVKAQCHDTVITHNAKHVVKTL